MMMRMLRAGLLFTGLALLLASGCSRKITECKPGVVYKPNELVARVDGQKMTWEQMEKRARNYLQDETNSKTLFILPGGEEKAMEYFRRKALMLFVNKTVMIEDAKRHGIEVTPADRQKCVTDFENYLKERNVATSIDDFFKKSSLGEKEVRHDFEDGILVDKFIKAVISSKITITDADREALANEVIGKRRDAKQKADSLRAQLLKGADFTALAGKEKNDDKRVIGGDIGDVTRGRLGDKQIEDAVFGQKINEVGPVLDTARGYMLIRVTAHIAAKPAVGSTSATPETAHAGFICVRTPPMLKGKEMERVIQSRKFDKALMDLLTSLRAKAKIETIYKDLRF